MKEILSERHSGRLFPGFDDVDLSFDELKTLVRNKSPDWRTALENVKGVYLITDTKTDKRYVGSAYGDKGIWSRWGEYVDSGGHGGNKALKELVTNPTLEYARTHFRFALLEHRSPKTSDDVILNREGFWKDILRTRKPGGLNHN